ncbi:MAG TPA: carbohydrate ABC transporter permease [Candidatus Saccharimonadales bacterium]|nr:carbohydrate ABC transporter permease [Candidatus Saccharimonadales bacterium]
MSSRRPSLGLAVVGVLLTAGALATAFPFVWMITTSLKPEQESVAYPPTLLPTTISLDGYIALFRDLDFGTYLMNTIVVVLIGFVGMLLVAMAGYAFAKFRFRGRDRMFLLVLATMMIPIQVTMIPTYLILNSLKLTNTLLGIALPTLVSAFNLFLFRQFMSTIPDDLLEAARLDGASEWRILRTIVLPLSRPILAVQGVLTFIAGWNSFLWPLIVANDQNKYTLSVGVALLNKQLTIDPPLQMAAASVMVIPLVLVFVVVQRHIVAGFTMSGLK